MVQAIPATATVFAECPVWLPGPQRLFWIDCAAGRLFSLDWSTQAVELVVSLPDTLLFGLVRHTEDCLLLLSGDGLLVVDLQGGAARVALPPIVNVDLLNDAKADRAGRLWIGQVRSAPGLKDGALVRVAGKESASVISDLGIPNGPAFSPGGETIYFADSLAGAVDSLHLDRFGTPNADRRRLVTLPLEMGQPDGMTVDAEGHLIVAIFNGGMLLRIDPETSAAERIPLPVRQPTSCTFGGPDLRTLFVTVANGPWPEDRRRPGPPPAADPALASLYAIAMPAGGLPEPNIAVDVVGKPMREVRA